MNIYKKQNLIIVIAIIGIVLTFSISNYINQKKVYILSHQTTNDTLEENNSGNNHTNNDINSTDEYEIITEKIVVHIEGEVVSPGVYELESDKRVFDVIEAAGGLLETADRKKINLAKKIIDEEYIYIPNENSEDIEMENITSLSSKPNTNSNQNEGLVNINRANSSELVVLPGIGEVLANRIIEYRSEKGDFKSIEELRNVSGIGDKKFNEIKDKVILQ